MTKKKLTFEGVKNVLSRSEMKSIMAGSGCYLGGNSCNSDVQCCSNDCVTDSTDTVTRKTCKGDKPSGS